ncbi:MAG TPA: hypothetical protein PK323_13025 [Bacteroidia bacterium]|nr:hypothetical protein [Bacteroidia bacterium]
MKQVCCLLLILNFALVLAQSVELFAFPKIVIEGQTRQNFIPSGWTLVDSALGDLNKDHEMDMAFIIKSNDSLTTYTVKEQQGEAFVEVNRKEKYPRRILIVILKQPHKNSYRLINQSNSMIVGQNTKIEIVNHALKIEYNTSMHESTFSISSNYYFSYQNEQLWLSKFDRLSISGEQTEYCVIDFINKKMESTKGKAASAWKKLDTIQLKTMEEFKQPFVWYITEGITI